MVTPAKVLVPLVNIPQKQMHVGQPVVIYANVVNRGDTAGSYKVELKIADEVVETREGTVSGNKAIPLEFTVYKDEPGTYEVDINGQKSFFTIVGESSKDDTASIPWMYIVGGSIAFLLT